MHPADLLPASLAGVEDYLLDSAAQLEQAARTADLEDWIVQRLKHAEREVSVNFPLRRDSGETLASTGMVVQHSSARGPCLGPVLFGPDIHLAQLRALALHFTLQSALLDMPVGGSAGAIVCDPAQLSEIELRRLVEHYLWALRDLIGSRTSILAPAEYVPAWTHHLADAAAIVGKPAALGGIPDMPAAVATGWLALISEALPPKSGRSPRPALEGLRVALQGFGPAAAALAGFLCEAGARVIALADKSGGLFTERGLDIAAIRDHVGENGILYGFPHAEPVRNSEVLESGSDLLITAAAERQVTVQNAPHIRAPLVLEAVYNAVTPAAAFMLESREVTLIPSLLAAAPATLAWVFEWQHALCHSAPKQAQIETAIREQLASAFDSVRSAATGQNSGLTATCRLLALEKLASVVRLTG